MLNSIPQGEEDEVKSRIGISRAYYSAFHRADKFLKSINQTIDIHKKGSHENVIKIFAEFGQNNRAYAFVAEELKRLKEMRQKADYHDKYFTFESNAASLRRELRTAVLRAKNIIEKIDSIEAEEKLNR